MMETYPNLAGTSQQQAIPTEESAKQFRQLLATAITMRIRQLAATGGPTIAQAQAVTGHLNRATSAPLYSLLREVGEEGPTVGQVTETLAILSFIPGGFCALGLSCQANTTPPVVFCSATL